MINAIIVDDEDIVRLTLMSIVDWEELGIEIVGTYANGKQVISHLEQGGDVALIITDINMPILGGLDLIKKLNEMNIKMEYLVISAYDDYELVREAFKLGVTDYILKQNISKQTLTKLVKNIVSRIDTAHISSAGDKRKDIERWIYNTIFNHTSGNSHKALENHISEEIEFNNLSKLLKEEGFDYYTICFISVEDYREVLTHFGTDLQKDFILPFKQTIMQIESTSNKFYLVNRHQNEFALVITYSSDDYNHNNIKQELKTILNRISTQLKSFLNISVTLSISECSQDANQLQSMFIKTQQRIRYKYIFGNNIIIHPELISALEMTYDRYYSKVIKPFVHSSIELDKAKLDLNIERLDRMMEVDCIEDPLNTTMSCYLLIICEIGDYLESIQDNMMNVYGKAMNYYQHLHKFPSSHELKVFMKNWIEWFMDYMSGQSNRVDSNVIEKSKKYILMNFSRPDLSIVEVSDYLGFSDKHFSSLFSKEVGITYKEYLTDLRIEKAKLLMKNSNRKVYEIGNEVGYNNTEHFSRVFKKTTGFSPNEYKKIHF